MREFLSMPFRQIADVVGVPENTVKSRMRYALEKLRGVDGLVIFGPDDPVRRGGLVSFHDPQVHPHDMSTILDQFGIAIRAGHHCAQPLHRRLGVVATSRASFGVHTTTGEIDALVAGILEARKVFAL